LFECEPGSLIYRLQYNGRRRLGIALDKPNNVPNVVNFDGELPNLEPLQGGDQLAVVWVQPDLRLIIHGDSAFYSTDCLNRNGAIITEKRSHFLRLGSDLVDLEKWQRVLDHKWDSDKAVAFERWSITVRKPGTENDRQELVQFKSKAPA
jgi:hypothetical protein